MPEKLLSHLFYKGFFHSVNLPLHRFAWASGEALLFVVANGRTYREKCQADFLGQRENITGVIRRQKARGPASPETLEFL